MSAKDSDHKKDNIDTDEDDAKVLDEDDIAILKAYVSFSFLFFSFLSFIVFFRICVTFLPSLLLLIV